MAMVGGWLVAMGERINCKVKLYLIGQFPSIYIF